MIFTSEKKNETLNNF